MLREIFRFELRQQFRSWLPWVFGVLFFAIGIALTSSSAVKMSVPAGTVHINAPMVIVTLGGMFAFLSMLFVVVFVVRALLRDFEQRTAETIFSTPVSRGSYLGGRLGAGFLIALGIGAAALVGAFLGAYMPWADAARLGPIMPMAWVWSFGVMLLPDVIFVTALLFALAAGTRSLLVSFIGVLALIVLRSVAGLLIRGLDHQLLAALLDPFGSHAIGAMARYWTAHAWNTQLPTLTGALLANRVLWLCISALLYAAGFFLFRTQRTGVQLRWPWRRKKTAVTAIPTQLELPAIGLHHGWRAHWRQLGSLCVMDTRSILRGALFIVMLLISYAILSVVLLMVGKAYGTTLYPVTHMMVSDIQGAFTLFLMIVLAFYAGELVWRDRALRVHEVGDALPVPDWVWLGSKAITLTIITLIFLAAGALGTIVFQLANGYTHLQPGLYALGLALTAIPFILTAVLALVLQALANNKFVGYLLFVLFLIAMAVVGFFDWADNLYHYAGGPNILYSDLNGYGHFLTGALWFYLYWALFALAILVVAMLFRKRGTDRRRRWRHAFSRLQHPSIYATLAVALVACGVCAGWLYYNTHILNSYVTKDQHQHLQAQYEKLYSKYAGAPQPRITAVKSRVAIYPYQRKLDLHVRYTLTNKHNKPIDKLYVNWNTDIPPTHITFPAHSIVKRDTRIGFTIYQLKQPLAPGASMTYSYDIHYDPQGFGNSVGGLDTRLVHNGTFLLNGPALFPSFGYNRKFQLKSKSERRKHGLKPEPRVPPLSENPAKRGNTYLSQDSDWIHFDTVVSTAGDQTAIAPGELMRSWTKGGRNYFHYQTHAPILNFYVYLSGKWAVKRAKWHDVTISIYYNPAHYWNVDDILAAAKDALRYDSTHFGPYQFDYLRIVEVPEYGGSYAQTFPGTVAFSESAGFIAKLGGKGSINYPFYITAHEVSHNWWAHQVIGANMQGATVLSESLAQYSSLMVMKHHFGANKMRRFLQYELDKYLRGRLTDRNGENPLGKVEGQPYIRYHKAAVVLYALQDYIGEDVIDSALRTFLDTYRFKGPPYPTSTDLVKDIKAAAGPKWDQLIDDSFWKITLYDNRVISATAKKLPNGKYEVTMKVHAAKYYANAKGKQTPAKMTLPVGIGVFAKAPDGIEGDEPILYLNKRHVANGNSTITLTVSSKPYQVGIDPYNELIDRNSSDNRAKVVIGK